MAFTSSKVFVHETPNESKQSRFCGLLFKQLRKHVTDLRSWSFYCNILPNILQVYPSSKFFCK